MSLNSTESLQQVRSHRSTSLNRVNSKQTTLSNTRVGLGKRDSFPNSSSTIITTGNLGHRDINNRLNTRDYSIASNNRRSNSSALIELKPSTRRISNYSKPPPPPPSINRSTPSTRPLQRKISRNSLSSNSSVSSQTTEDTTATTGSSGGSLGSHGTGINSTSSGISGMGSNTSVRRTRIGSAPTISVVNGSGYLDTDTSYLKWKVRKREEKKLKERRNYLESQLRRH